jgi:mycothiol synthase
MEILVSRRYSSQDDLQPAIDLVLMCRAVEPIDPWPPIDELRHHLRLQAQHGSANTQVWERQSGELAAIATIWDGMTLIFSIHPQDVSEDLMAEILSWGIARARALARGDGERATLFVPIHADDRQAAALFERRGWSAEDWTFLRMARSLAAPIAAPCIPNGFTLRPVGSAQDLAAATALEQDVFVAGSSIVRDRLALRHTSEHVQASDLVVVAPDGSLAAFCLCIAGPLDTRHPAHTDGWIDLIGTRLAYRRRGLGRAILLAGLQQLKRFGADRALLGTASWNVAAQHLFATADFRLLHEIRWFVWAEDT